MGLRIIFTDLDSSLIDRDTYEYGENKILIDKLIKLKIPVVICTSKTIEETISFYDLFKTESPIVVENGGAILFNKNSKLNPEINIEILEEFNENYLIYKIGKHYKEFIDDFYKILYNNNIKIKLIHELEDDEIIRLTNLREKDIEDFKKRRYDLPFVFEKISKEKYLKISPELYKIGLRIHKGGRFYHITSDFDKSNAVLTLIKLYKTKANDIKTIGIGDSQNDLNMLKTVDLPCLIKKKDNTYEEKILKEIKTIIKSNNPAPEGWKEVIKIVIKEV